METVPVPVQVGETTVYIEMSSGSGAGEEHTSGGAIGRVQDSFERAKQTIVNLSSEMVRAVRSIDQALTPNEFTLEFGVKFTIDGNVVIAALSSEATLNVKLVYQHKPQP
jgi:hypothetical protein